MEYRGAPIKVAHFSTQDTSHGGGGVRATYFLHDTLRRFGCHSKLIVAKATEWDPDTVSVELTSSWQKAKLRGSAWMHTMLNRRYGVKTVFFADWLGASSSALVRVVGVTDILHLHWVATFVGSAQIRHLAFTTGAPIVWTLMDMAPLTGGCHYAGSCQGYQNKCGCCPQLHSCSNWDISRLSWERKKKNLRDLPITIIAPTKWVMERTRESSLFGKSRVEVIPLAIDDKIFRPLDSRVAREVLRLPQDKKVIFYGATFRSEERKGWRYFVEALQHLMHDVSLPLNLRNEIVVALAGFKSPGQTYDLPFPVYDLGYLKDNRTLALAYQAADVFVSSSIEDAGPMMIPEAMMCGTPVVAFNTGGAPDLIETMINGYLAQYRDSLDLAQGIARILFSENADLIRVNAAKSALVHHAPDTVVRQYLDLYRELCMKRNAK